MRPLFKYIFLFFLGLSIPHFVNAQNPGAIDTTFKSIYGFNREVRDIAVQSDGKLIVIGDFTFYGSHAVAGGIVRLHTDGSIDHSFNPGTGAPLYSLSEVCILNNGQIIIVGSTFTTYNGVEVGGIARLTTDGSLDLTFNTGGDGFSGLGPRAMYIQPDGKIILAGQTGSYNDFHSGPAVARLHADGTLDNTFNCTLQSLISVNAVIAKPDGKVVVAGSFIPTGAKYIIGVNADGTTDAGFVPPALNGTIYDMIVQADGKIIIGGVFSPANHKNIARLNLDGSYDNSFLAGSNITGGIFCLQEQADGKILAAGNVSLVEDVNADRIVRFSKDGAIDTSFRTGENYKIGTMTSIAVQDNGDIVVGGRFEDVQRLSAQCITRMHSDGSIDYNFNQGTSTPSTLLFDDEGRLMVNFSYYANGFISKQLSRLSKDGTLDETFSVAFDPSPKPRTAPPYVSTVTTMAVQPDGKIIISGDFTSIEGIATYHLARLNADGSLDRTFTAELSENDYATTILLQPDGKIILGGNFDGISGVVTGAIARLNSDGTLDPSFSSAILHGFVEHMVLLSDRKILVGGSFDIPGNATSISLTCLLHNGSVDHSFHPNNTYLTTIYKLAVQQDGKIILATRFGNFGRIKRLNADGTEDFSFRTGAGANGAIRSLVLQKDGKIIIGGEFTAFNNQQHGRLMRLNVDGSWDESFSTGPGGNVHDLVLQPDGKIIAVGEFSDVSNLTSVLHLYRMHGDPIYYNTIKGNVYTDSNEDCILQPGETKLPSVIIKAEGNNATFYGGSDAYGNYQVRVDSGTVAYSIAQQSNGKLGSIVINQCEASHVVNLTGVATEICCYDFADTIRDCSLLSVEIETSRLRRCFRNTAVVTYGNFGSAAADQVVVKVLFPSYVVPLATFPAWSAKSGDTLIYNVGHLHPRERGSIYIIDSVVCGMEQIRGLTQCFQAFISPSSSCFPENPLWDKSSVQVTGVCMYNNAHFEITNTGIAAMSEDSEFRVFENDTLIYTSSLSLATGQKIIVEYPSSGATMRLEVDQSAHHPGESKPRATVEGCGVMDLNTAVKGLVTTYQQDDLEAGKSTACQIILDSFDPNDKKAMPIGAGVDHVVEAGERIKYTIRFQNTGTDTAYTVRVVDTLDTHLDIASFTEATSSHPYRLEVSGKDKAVLTFNFDQIKLVDSTKNELASHGFVSFYIHTKQDLTDGIEIKNTSGIYFDYNSPVITNTTTHTIGYYTASNLSKGDLVQVTAGPLALYNQVAEHAVILFPNPASGTVQVQRQHHVNDALLIIQDLSGHEVFSSLLKGETTAVSLAGLSSGMYLYKVESNGAFVGAGKIVVK